MVLTCFVERARETTIIQEKLKKQLYKPQDKTTVLKFRILDPVNQLLDVFLKKRYK